MRPSEGDPIYSPKRIGQPLGQVSEVVFRVAYPCRWFVYDLRGQGFPVEPRSAGGWIEVVEA
jgi:hypothetical protein